MKRVGVTGPMLEYQAIGPLAWINPLPTANQALPKASGGWGAWLTHRSGSPTMLGHYGEIGGYTMRRMIGLLATLPASAILISGCGSSAGESAAPAAGGAGASAASVSEGGASQPALEAAVRAYSDAYLTGQGSAAYGLLSERCQQRINQAEFTGLTQAARVQYGSQPIAALTVDSLAGTLARVTYTYPTSAINQQSEPWVFEKGTWRQDDC
ncbi:conserved hypothetical protein [Frankia canadensis]|uniref:Uncharacterized protein n=2 Tax=Frankia canadensis TaxID=1836972 RepID=A0A2I2L179_9ACTN|nr:conserved hypothetical protein [Frankia canadensis]SOU58973.1 conserved hypothetical protein [Frankia canadensis]